MIRLFSATVLLVGLLAVAGCNNAQPAPPTPPTPQQNQAISNAPPAAQAVLKGVIPPGTTTAPAGAGGKANNN